MKLAFRRVHSLAGTLTHRFRGAWRRYRGLRKPYQVVIAAVAIVLLFWGITMARSGAEVPQTAEGRKVTLSTVGELTNTGSNVNLYGTVRSVTEAKILAQTGGVVRAVHASVGGRVGAGAIIAELENASERAAVLSAEGAYEGALATQNASSPIDARTSAINASKAAFNTLDTALQAQVDLFFGDATAYGPRLVISAPMYDYGELSTERRNLSDTMEALEDAISNPAADPSTLLMQANTIAQNASDFLNRLATAAHAPSSAATAEQLTALSTARASVNALLTSISAAQESYRSERITTTSSTEAGVKQALGALRSAQAALEQTMVRAPIAGQVNFLPIRVGDYVAAIQHVATVAQNGSLEVIVYVSEDSRSLLAAGGSVSVEGEYQGVITSIAPALDPITKQIEVRIAVTGANELVNGQSVTVSLPNAAPTEPVTEGPLLLPLSAVKLRAGDRVVFTVDAESRLVAHPVEVGEVRGDRIEILTPLERAMQIVSDARGLAEGEAVEVVSASVSLPAAEL